MKKTLSLVVAGAVFCCGFVGLAVSQPAAPPGNTPADDPQGEYFSPGLDDLMTMLVQPRHTKLYYAGQAKNWELAAAETRELRTALNRVAATIPKLHGYDIPVMMDRFMFTELDNMAAATAKGDAKRFTTAYKALTAGCNGCHTYMEHPYDVIKVPDAKNSAYPDQAFQSGQ